MGLTTSNFNKFWENVGNGNINLDTGTFKVMLVKPTFVFDPTYELLSEVSSHELTAGNGYTAGGLTISNTGFAFDVARDLTVMSGDSITWSASGGDIGPAIGAIMYCTSGNRLVHYIDFGEEQTAADSTDFQLNFSTYGIFTI